MAEPQPEQPQQPLESCLDTSGPHYYTPSSAPKPMAPLAIENAKIDLAGCLFIGSVGTVAFIHEYVLVPFQKASYALRGIKYDVVEDDKYGISMVVPRDKF